MSIPDIKIGGMYCFAKSNGIAHVLRDPCDEYTQTSFVILRGTIIVPLRFVWVLRPPTAKAYFRRMQILDSTGRIGWIRLSTDSIEDICSIEEYVGE
jgi:hypothetical protein